MLDRVRNWGGTEAEHARRYPCDDYLTGPDLIGPDLAGPVERLTRAVTVHAPAALVYRWLCQLSVAPYSYDWLDNLGRRSPRTLTPGADELRVGQRLMIFELVEVEPGHRFSGRSYRAAERLFGPVAGTYAAEPLDAESCRLVCRLVLGARRPFGGAWATALACGDLIMMRKQLLTLRRLAERDARAAGGNVRA